MTDLTLVSFYTPNWKYPAHAERLRRECDALGVPHYIVERPDLGDYLANCRWKPSVLREARTVLSGPILWVDVDGSLLQRPTLDSTCDFMAYPKPDTDERQWHVGTLWFGDTEDARVLLWRWVRALAPDISDELALDRMWKTGEWEGTYEPLPPAYFQLGRPCEGAVVRHRLSHSEHKRAYQASVRGT